MNLYRLAPARTLDDQPIDTHVVTQLLEALEIALVELFGSAPASTQTLADSLYLMHLAKLEKPFVIRGTQFSMMQGKGAKPVAGQPGWYASAYKARATRNK